MTAVLIFGSIKYLSIFNTCNERNASLQSAVTSVDSHLNSLSINGSAPSAVESRKDGDCLTGHGAVGTASFNNLSSLSLSEANTRVLQSLNSPTSQNDQIFTLEDTDGNELIDSMQTELINGIDSRNYEVSYFFASEIACPDYDDRYKICTKNETAADIHNRMTKTINKVELTLRILTD